MSSITVAKNGMLIGKDLPLQDTDGNEIAPTGIQKLCRCGDSKTKPFCDDTHLTNGFTGDKSPDRVPEQEDAYEGKDLTIMDDRGTCSHAGFCTDLMASVWKSGQEPWIDPDGGPAEDIMDVIRRCPSGALAYRLAGGDVQDSFHDDPTVIVAPAGPYRVRGGPELKDPDGNTPRSAEHYALCRCGNSKNKPFCDGTHWYVNFGHKGAPTTARTETDGYVGVGAPDDFDEGAPKSVQTDGLDVLVFKLWGRICAVGATHNGASMADGTVDGGRFVAPDGTGYTCYPWARAAGDDLPVHDVIIVGGQVFVASEPEAAPAA